jgi:uncharacterized repeat protein (TIGR02543 family)
MSRTIDVSPTRRYDSIIGNRKSPEEALTMKQSVHVVLTLVLCLALSLVGVLVGVPAARAADTGAWTPVNTSLGNVYVYVMFLVINPLTPSILYASNGGGVFRSTDSGATWSAVNTGLTGRPSQTISISITSLVINPFTPATLYAGTGRDGVFRSTDSGDHWTAVNTGLTNTDIYSLAIDPVTPSTLYAGTGRGVFLSWNSGTTWWPTDPTNSLTNTEIQGLVIDPLTPSTLYAGTSYGLLRSTDNGYHWTELRVSPTSGGGYGYALVIDPLTPSTLYAGTDFYGVLRSTDSGTTWTPTGLTNTEIRGLAIDPLTPSTLYAGTDHSGVFRSTDSGDHWTAMNNGLPEYGGVISPSFRSLVVAPLTPSVLYAVTDMDNQSHIGGVLRYGAVSSYALTTTASPAAGGSVKRSPNATSYASGTVVTLTATPATGYTFAGWSGALTGTKNPATVRMDAAKKITASFAVKSKRVIQLKIGSSTMYVDGKPVALEAALIILNLRTLLPVRAVVEAAGGTIAWEASTQKVTIVRNDKKLELWIGRNVAKVNNLSTYIDTDPKVVPIIMSGRTLLPLRFVAEALALDVQWNAATQTITITYTP